MDGLRDTGYWMQDAGYRRTKARLWRRQTVIREGRYYADLLFGWDKISELAEEEIPAIH